MKDWEIVWKLDEYTGVRKHFHRESDIAKRDGKNANLRDEIFKEYRKDGTKKHYVSYLRQWCFYCMDFQINPLWMPFDPEVVQLWICDRINCIGTIKSLNQWLSMLQWIAEIFDKPSDWKKHPS